MFAKKGRVYTKEIQLPFFISATSLPLNYWRVAYLDVHYYNRDSENFPPIALCVNIDVASNKEVNYGIFKSSDGRRVKKSLAA